jgi:hypothetical protein
LNTLTDTIAATFSLGGFATAAICGLLAGNPAHEVVVRSIIAMVVCNLVGKASASCINFAVEEHLADYTNSRPIPSIDSNDGGDSEVIEVGDDDASQRPATVGSLGQGSKNNS